jgi:hypothetical protein
MSRKKEQDSDWNTKIVIWGLFFGASKKSIF